MYKAPVFTKKWNNVWRYTRIDLSTVYGTFLVNTPPCRTKVGILKYGKLNFDLEFVNITLIEWES